MKAFSSLTRSEEDRRVLIVWAAACAERVLDLFEAVRSGDDRPRKAVEGARAWARGKIRVGDARRLAFASHAAAREAAQPEAVAAARACGQAVAVAHMAGHARGAADYAAKAVSFANSTGSESAQSEVAWQRANVPEQFLSFVYPEDA